jgi:hypothetical protein
MLAVSLATRPLDSEKVRSSVFVGFGEPFEGIKDYRLWAGLLFLCTIALWWGFR